MPGSSVLWWTGWDKARPVLAIGARLRVLVPPAAGNPYVASWGTSFQLTDGTLTDFGSGHFGLQWQPDHPNSLAINFGIYTPPGSPTLTYSGSTSSFPSANNDPNTRDYPWVVGADYDFRLHRTALGWSCYVRGPDAVWTLIREVWAPGSRLILPASWLEQLYIPDGADPATSVRWSRMWVAFSDDGSDPMAVGTAQQVTSGDTYYNIPAPDTNVAPDTTAGVLFATRVTRSNPTGASITYRPVLDVAPPVWIADGFDAAVGWDAPIGWDGGAVSPVAPAAFRARLSRVRDGSVLRGGYLKDEPVMPGDPLVPPSELPPTAWSQRIRSEFSIDSAWQWVLVSKDDAYALHTAKSRRLTLRLTGSNEAEFTLDGREPVAAQIMEMATDLCLYRTGYSEPLARLQIGPSSDDLDENQHRVSYNAIDYREVLRGRILYPTDTLAFAAQGDSAIVWSMITASQSRGSGSLGITAGSGFASGVARTVQYRAGESIGQAIDSLGKGDSSTGFDWWVDGLLRIHLARPRGGSNVDTILDYGGTVTRVRRAVNPAAYANVLVASGATEAGVAVVASNALSSAIGRREKAVSWPQITTPAALTARSAGELAWLERAPRGLELTLRPGVWRGPATLDLGDLVFVRVRSGRLDIAETQRVTQIEINIDDSGVEAVSVVTVPPDPWDPFAEG